MTVLAIDSSNDVMGIALVDESKVIGEIITNVKKNHSIRVMPAIESLLKDCNISTKELSKIIVAKGPGSYTGVRIGVTIAKTLAWSLQIPLSGVSSLEVLAANGRFFPGYISPLFDARRGQIYTGLYSYKADELQQVKQDQNVLSSDWAKSLSSLDKPILLLGNDVELHKEVMISELKDKAVFAAESLNNPRPAELAWLGMYRENEDIHQFSPNYIRLAEAEAKWLEAQKKESGAANGNNNIV
ncbi:tRNA (adenosine(37)-N6)-threonylcarbamoyltransferase complex dimerization subunit type 1 TsaB [Bacillus sp. SM2101]|uniref:tRNA (adenosine(37)-N6)-threonylcarbamoyltransferase complex dimerization subunit type 1 TsaB n=1 Tax=Bacillus sp. SM2101 TaxID=2805366 RepID=UPI001BDF4765|nr:tRNA (adenosine(37)-N6)-threonylcarbamoyltransferase complex dimerization subunit type 1 TsaB [Bacillus sp. SM2101]